MTTRTEALEALVEVLADLVAEKVAAKLQQRRPDPDELVDRTRSGLTPDEWRGAIHRGELPAVRTGRRYVVRRADLDAFLRDRAVSVKKAAPSAVANDDGLDDFEIAMARSKVRKAGAR